MEQDIIKKDEKWEYLVEQIKATIVEAVHNSRWILIEGYWNIGKLIREEVNPQKNVTELLTDLSVKTNVSERTLWRALACYDKYPKLDTIPEGKNISWNKLITKYLPHKEEIKKDQEVGYKPMDAENLWDWICSRVGFDEKGIEIQKAIREFVKLKINEKQEVRKCI